MRTVITYGTFDLFHKGHYNILKRAKDEGDYLIVAVTGEKYDNERGKLSVQDSLATRIKNVNDTGFADKIIVEEYLGQKISDILKYNVDVLVIGSDWKGKFDHLKKYCEVKYLERTKDISSTQLREETLSIFRLGIVTDDLYDNGSVLESKVVSGIHVESVYSSDSKLAEEFSSKFELNEGYSDFDDFLDNIDIIYIKVKGSERAKYVRKAIEAGKHVITDVPFTMDAGEANELKNIAKEKGLVLKENISMLYQDAFMQLIWMARGNLIGDIINMRCVISKKQFSNGSSFDIKELAFYPLCAFTKVLGISYEDFSVKTVKDSNDETVYANLEIPFGNSVATAEIYLDVDVDVTTGMSIIGTNGSIFVPDDWWHVGYFKVRQPGEEKAKRYSSNFDGNGFRYLIQNALSEIRREEGGYKPQLTNEETQAIIKIISNI